MCWPARGREAAVVAGFETDGQGRFRVNPPPTDGEYRVTAYPPDGKPYLIDEKRIVWPEGGFEQSLDLALPRGVLIRGTVTEEGSGDAVPGATLDFLPFTPRGSGGERGITGADGSFQLGATPSPGYLFLRGPSDDYVLQAIGSRMFQDREPGGIRFYLHAFSSLDLKPGTGDKEVHLVLRRGATVKGKVVGPDGQPVSDAWIFSRVILDPRRGASGIWNGRYHGNAHNGRFEVHGLALNTEDPLLLPRSEAQAGRVRRRQPRDQFGGQACRPTFISNPAAPPRPGSSIPAASRLPYVSLAG